MIIIRSPTSFIILILVLVYPHSCSSESKPERDQQLHQELGVIYSPHEVERDSRQFSFFEWLFGPPVAANSTGMATSHPNRTHHSEQSILKKKISAKNAQLGQPNKTDEDESPSLSSILDGSSRTSLIPRNNSDPEHQFQGGASNISHDQMFVAKPRTSENHDDRSNHSRQIEITDIQKSVGTEIDDTHVNSDPSQLNLQEELDVIDHVEKNLSNHPNPLSRSQLPSLMSNKTRTKRQSKSTSKFRQLNIPYGSGANNFLLAKRQLLINPVDQQMLALRQQQELAAATILTQQQMLNRYNNRYVDDYYDDDDSSYEDSDEFFDDYRRYGVRHPINDNMRHSGPYLRPNHPMGLGRRSLPDEIPTERKSPGSVFNAQKKEKKLGKAGQKSEGGGSLLGPISKQGRWETIEDYDVDSEFNRIQSRKGEPMGIPNFGMKSLKHRNSEEADARDEGVMHNNGISRIGSLARHNLPKLERQETSSEETSTSEQESATTSMTSEETPTEPTEPTTIASPSTDGEEPSSTPIETEETTTNETPTSESSGENTPGLATNPTDSTTSSSSSTTTSIPAEGSNSTTSGSSTTTTTTTEIPITNTTTGGMSSTTTKKPASTTKKPKPRPVPPYRQTLNCRCGVQSVRGEDVGDGTIIRTMVNPWLVAVSSKHNGNPVHLCSGSIINNKYVLTSKQCVRGKKTLVVTAGTGSRATKNFTVTRVVTHDSRDIALLKFKPPLNPNQSMRPICLPLKKSSFKFEPLTGTLVTFKKSTNVKSGSYFLQLVQTEVPLESGQKCSSEGEDGEENHLPAGTLCHGPPGSLRCGGDTGGILQAYQKGFSYEQIGVVSNTVGCRANKAPGVYTDVRKSVKWILHQTKDSRYCRKPKVSRKELMEARRIAVASEGDEPTDSNEDGESEEHDESQFDEEFEEEFNDE